MVRRDFKYNGSDSIIHDGKFKKAQSLINIGEAHIFGGSFHAKADVNKWLSLTSSLNFVIGEDVVEKVPLRHASPIFGSSSAIVNVKKIKAELDISYNGPKKWENMPPDELAKPHLYTPEGSLAWTVFSIYSNYQFNRNLTFQFDVENIFDIHYRPYSSGISAPGRNFVFALKCLF